MGSHTWVRDSKKPAGGKTFAVGVAAVIPQAPPPSKKRKLVWQRGDPSNLDTAETGTDAGPSTGQPPDKKPATETGAKLRATAAPFPPNKQKPSAAASSKTGAAAAPTQKKKEELEALKRQIEQRTAALEQTKAAAIAAAVAEEEAKEVEREQRKKKLEAGFQSAFAAAKEAATADIAASRAPVSFADRTEVQRVLAAGSDYGVLKLAPGADGASVRRRYREMAVQLHPDKCKIDGAGDAFHRLVKAYQQLSKYAK